MNFALPLISWGLFAAMAGSMGATAGRGAVARDVRQLYAQLCANCHGEDLEGAKAGSLLDRTWRGGGDDAELARSIRDGVTGSAMPAFGGTLSPAEVRAMVVFIRETATRVRSPEPRGTKPLPEGVQRSEVEAYRIEPVAEGFEVPWSMAFLPDGRILVTERVGRLRVVENGKLRPEPIAGVPPVWVRDEGGLLGVAVAPDFAESGGVYLSLSDPGPNGTAMTKVIRGRLHEGRLSEVRAIFAAPPEAYRDDGTHFGSRLLVDGRYLFFSVGERGAVGEAQDLRKPNGKVHRVYLDGSVPPDNPFVATPGAVASIWSYGHRNPQGLARDPRTGALWGTEHGPRGGDELNRLVRGANYGWPLVTHGMNYDGTPVSAATEAPGLEPPVAYWTPSIAVCPVAIYTGGRFPRWKNQLFVGSLAQQELRRIVVDESGRARHQEIVFKHLGRVRDLATGPDGALYVALEASPGRIVRLVPAE